MNFSFVIEARFSAVVSHKLCQYHELDEYSSLRHKRYQNINAYQDKDKFWNLMMVAISGRMTAEKTVEEVENKLSEFSLSLSRHIVVVVPDGTSAMVKFGQCDDCEHQLCYARA